MKKILVLLAFLLIAGCSDSGTEPKISNTFENFNEDIGFFPNLQQTVEYEGNVELFSLNLWMYPTQSIELRIEKINGIEMQILKYNVGSKVFNVAKNKPNSNQIEYLFFDEYMNYLDIIYFKKYTSLQDNYSEAFNFYFQNVQKQHPFAYIQQYYFTSNNNLLLFQNMLVKLPDGSYVLASKKAFEDFSIFVDKTGEITKDDYFSRKISAK